MTNGVTGTLGISVCLFVCQDGKHAKPVAPFVSRIATCIERYGAK